MNSSSEVVHPLLQDEKKQSQNHAAPYFMVTALCGCVMLQGLVCDIEPFLRNQSTGFYWRREASEVAESYLALGP